jgi:hypothetical protein
MYLTTATVSLTDVGPVNLLSPQRPQEVCAKA